ncbi:hypothetical protein IVA95_18715 [Bradyrhizobium sp. 157]|uniref:hypothetical protein n=1 Tax=Bradyrhizobium sp. 157 TaxID=2782631 RepID=UPI001FFA729D|nr:hypothetical protein [Bradyrhizobium sp. 157]MCK1639592.1 hypothetical protein [Bradyrhizobium sp. 157]
MKKSISVNKKSRGRPKKKGGVDPVTAVRLPRELSDAVDTWAANQDDEPVRSEAIRRLVEIGLSKSPSPKRPRVLSTAKQGAERAVELASDVIGDQMPNISDEEKTTRRRRLIKGPSEFRNVRRDRP